MEWVKVLYEGIRKPGDPEFVPSRVGGLGSGIGSHAEHRMVYNARILFRVTVGFSAAGRLSLGRAFSLFPKAERVSGTGSPANPKLSGWQPGCTTGLRPGVILLVSLLQIVLSLVLSSNLKKETLVERIRYQG